MSSRGYQLSWVPTVLGTACMPVAGGQPGWVCVEKQGCRDHGCFWVRFGRDPELSL